MPSLQFTPSTLASFDAKGSSVSKLKVFFFGVFGVNGPLPLHLTEFARSRIRNSKDDTFAEFADLFHHRLLSLFYRAWADKEPTVQFDRADKDRFAFYVGSLLGIGESSQQGRDTIPDYTKLHFAAHLGCHTKHASGLHAILSDFLQMPIQIEEFIGEWLNIPKDSYCYLDDDMNTGQLGVSAVIGTRSWQCQHKFRIIIGPLELSEYESLLPSGDKLEDLHCLVKNYIGFEYSWEVNLVLKKQQVPTVQVGEFGRLGWTSWLEAGTREVDVNDLYLNMGEMV
ncbi:type VI secretion protein, VC_A0111 family [methanotrophic bacterial endosymbiont of Bathymodiolus sp.]|nr:type VI secretion protein, VC_A0111 family [methanotrophic bacterial endosymbiont of Bathymodiolus sp.]